MELLITGYCEEALKLGLPPQPAFMHYMLQAADGQPLLDSLDLEGIAKRIKSGM